MIIEQLSNICFYVSDQTVPNYYFSDGNILQTWSTGQDRISAVSEGLVVGDKMYMGSFMNTYVGETDYVPAK